MDDEKLPQDDSTRSIRSIAILSGAVPTVFAILAIAFCLFLLEQNNQLSQSRDCTRRIDLYVSDIRDNINTQGWDSLVSRVEGSANVDVQQVAREMRAQISLLQRSKDMRDRAIKICEADPEFTPPR